MFDTSAGEMTINWWEDEPAIEPVPGKRWYVQVRADVWNHETNFYMLLIYEGNENNGEQRFRPGGTSGTSGTSNKEEWMESGWCQWLFSCWKIISSSCCSATDTWKRLLRFNLAANHTRVVSERFTPRCYSFRCEAGEETSTVTPPHRRSRLRFCSAAATSHDGSSRNVTTRLVRQSDSINTSPWLQLEIWAAQRPSAAVWGDLLSTSS